MRAGLQRLIFILLLLASGVVFAAEAEQKNVDTKWFQFNLMRSIDNKIPFGNQQDTYLEMEFGGRSGIIDLYGYLDIFDIFDSSDSDRHRPQSDNFFVKLAPRFSIDGMMSQGPRDTFFREFYIATLFNIGDQALFEQFVGLGTDLNIPVWGRLSVNLMARYVRENYGADNERQWDGYILSTNWFRPFVFFENGSFISYQGYLEHRFAAYAIDDSVDRSHSATEWFNGFYWHSERYAVGYGVKLYQDMALLKNDGFAGETSGVGHYLSLTYKF